MKTKKPYFKPSIVSAASALRQTGKLYGFMWPDNRPMRVLLIYHLTGEWLPAAKATTDRLVAAYVKAAGVTSYTCFADMQQQCVEWADKVVKEGINANV